MINLWLKKKKEQQKVEKKIKFTLKRLLKIVSTRRIVAILKYLLFLIILIVIIVLLVFFLTRDGKDENKLSIFNRSYNKNTNSMKMPPGIDWFLANKEGGGNHCQYCRYQ